MLGRNLFVSGLQNNTILFLCYAAVDECDPPATIQPLLILPQFGETKGVTQAGINKCTESPI